MKLAFDGIAFVIHSVAREISRATEWVIYLIFLQLLSRLFLLHIRCQGSRAYFEIRDEANFLAFKKKEYIKQQLVSTICHLLFCNTDRISAVKGYGALCFGHICFRGIVG